MALMDLDQNTAVPAACCSGSGARAMKSKSHSNKNSHPDGRAKFLDTKNFIKKKKVSKSPLKKRSIEKEENYGKRQVTPPLPCSSLKFHPGWKTCTFQLTRQCEQIGKTIG